MELGGRAWLAGHGGGSSDSLAGAPVRPQPRRKRSFEARLYCGQSDAATLFTASPPRGSSAVTATLANLKSGG